METGTRMAWTRKERKTKMRKSYIAQRKDDQRKVCEAIAAALMINPSNIRCQDWEQKSRGVKNGGWRPFWMMVSIEEPLEIQDAFLVVKKYESLISGKWREENGVTKIMVVSGVNANPHKAEEMFENVPLPDWSSRKKEMESLD